MEDFYISFLRDLKNCPKTWEEITQKYPNEHAGIWLEVRDKHLLVQSGDEKYHLSFEARFKLLEYEELSEARISSIKAQKLSLIAIGIAIIAIFVSIFLGYQQIDLSKKQESTNERSTSAYLDYINYLNEIASHIDGNLTSYLSEINKKLETISTELNSFQNKQNNTPVADTKK